VEVGAFVEEGADFPGAFRAFFLAADKNSAAGAGGKGRKATIITSFLVRHKNPSVVFFYKS
jgi:hypothetical protein